MKYVIKKITGLIIALLIVSMLAFLAFEIIPGDPARTILGTEATESKVQALSLIHILHANASKSIYA